ncbi:MAG: DUF3108 domain-containing protein [Stellaceae bacterium]
MRAARRPRRIGVLLGFAALAAGWSGGGRAQDIRATYSATWAGLPAAGVRLILHDGTTRYDDRIVIATRGLPWLFTRFRGSATAEGRIGTRIPAEPLAYDAIFDLHKRRDRRISLRFVRRGDARVIERGPANSSDKPPLARRFRTNAVDPLSALERIREAIAAAPVPGASFTVPVYDGTRRFDVVGRILSRSRGNPGTLRLDLILRPIAGFKNRPGAEDPENAPRTVELLVTDDGRALPLWLRVPIWYLPLVVRLDRLDGGAQR